MRTWPAALALSTVLLACHNPSVAPPPAADLQRGGVYIAYNLGCEEGCGELARGDVILAVDGQVVETRADLLAAGIMDDRAVALDVVRSGETSPHRVTIRAQPDDEFPPLAATPPFLTVGAEALDRAPEWARAPMFSHAIPKFGFLHVDGGWITGRDLYGHETLMVIWPYLPLYDRQYRNFREPMATIYGVLQKAQADLDAHHVDIVFAVCGGQNDTTVRRELATMGQPLPPLPVYRCPSTQGPGGQVEAGTEGSPARHLGLENGARLFDYVRGFPAIIIVDEGGIVRWHSSGFYEGPQNTILAALMFAMRELDERPGTIIDGE